MSASAVHPSTRKGATGRRLAALSLIGILAVGALAPIDAEARRMGNSRSVGRQSQMAPSQSPNAAPATSPSPSSPGQPQRAQQAQPAQQTPAAAPAAAQPRNRWLAPLAGLAAGLGIGALLSHFGLGEGLAQFLSNALMIGLIVIAGLALFRFIARKRRPDLAYSHGGNAPRHGDFSRSEPYATPASMAGSTQGTTPASGSFGGAAGAVGSTGSAIGGTTQSPVVTGRIPAGFDTEQFLRTSKVSFVRLQAAWDKGDQGDIYEFTTPEMFAEVKMDLEARGKVSNRTDVVELDAELLGVEEHGNEQLASVRFHGLIRESEHEAAKSFEEVWNFVQDTRADRIWRLAGIQQIA